MAEYAVLRNRTTRALEFLFDGVVYQLPPEGQVIVDAAAAFHVIALEKLMAVAADGTRVSCVGLEDGPPELRNRLGEQGADCSPVELADTQPAEGWGITRTPGEVQTQPVRGYSRREVQDRLSAGSPEYVRGG